MSLAIERTSFIERSQNISFYDLVRNNTLNTLQIKNGVLPYVEVMGDGGVFVQTQQISHDDVSRLFYKSVYLILDELYHPTPDYAETFVKILPSSNIMKISKCISMNGEYNIDYLINANNSEIKTTYELRNDENGIPERISHSDIVSKEFRNIQAISNMIFEQSNSNNNGISNTFIKKYILIHDK